MDDYSDKTAKLRSCFPEDIARYTITQKVVKYILDPFTGHGDDLYVRNVLERDVKHQSDKQIK